MSNAASAALGKSPAFRFYPSDFMMGTMGFSAEERGAYMTLLCVQWDRGGLPDDVEQCARLAGIPPERLGLIWVKFGLCDDGMRRNRRLELEREKQVAFRARQSENGKNGGRGRKKNPNETQTKPTVNPSLFQTKANGKPEDSQAEANAKPEKAFQFSSSLSVVPPTVPQGGQCDTVSSETELPQKKEKGALAERAMAIALAVEWADHIGALFGRTPGRASSAMLNWLEDHALRGLLPPDAEQWAALQRMHAAAKVAGASPEDRELKSRWLRAAEAMAEHLPAALDRASAWDREHGAPVRTPKKKAAPDPEGWREWLAGAYPRAVVPASFWDLPPELRAEFEGGAA